MRKIPASVLVIGILVWLSFSPMMAMHDNGRPADCLVSIGGISCLSSSGLLTHLRAVQEVLLATAQQPTTGMLALMFVVVFLFALATTTPAMVPFGSRVTYSRLPRWKESVSLALRPLLSWQSRLQHSPTTL